MLVYYYVPYRPLLYRRKLSLVSTQEVVGYAVVESRSVFFG